jgi:hypothetical protein
MTIQAASSHALVCGPARANGTVATATTTKPATAMAREPNRSMLLPATVRDKTLPTPCGTSMTPAASAVVPRTSW